MSTICPPFQKITPDKQRASSALSVSEEENAICTGDLVGAVQLGTHANLNHYNSEDSDLIL